MIKKSLYIVVFYFFKLLFTLAAYRIIVALDLINLIKCFQKLCLSTIKYQNRIKIFH